MPVISRRYSSSSGASLPPTGTYRTSTLDRAYCNTTTNSYITPRVSTHSRISSFDSYRYESVPKKSTAITYQKYSKGLDTTDTSRCRRSESRSRDTGLGSSSDTLSRNDAVFNRIMATSAADIINKYSPANYIPKCELVRSRSLSDPRNIKEKSQVHCDICQSNITPQFNALNIPCNNTKCTTNINISNCDVGVEGLSYFSSTNKFNSFDITNSGTKNKPIYRTIPERNYNSANIINVSPGKNILEKIHTLPSKDENVATNKIKKMLGEKRRFNNTITNKIESCPDIRQWPNNMEFESKNDIVNMSGANATVCKSQTHKTKVTVNKSDNISVNKATTSNLHSNNYLKKSKNEFRKHSNSDSDNNGNKLVGNVAEIRKKFGHQQSKNSSYVVWSNLGKNKKLPKPSSDNTTVIGANLNLRKSLKREEKPIKNIGSQTCEKSVDLKKKIRKNPEIIIDHVSPVNLENNSSDLTVSRSFEEILDRCNKNVNTKCTSAKINLRSPSDCILKQNDRNVKQNKEIIVQILQLPANEVNNSDASSTSGKEYKFKTNSVELPLKCTNTTNADKFDERCIKLNNAQDNYISDSADDIESNSILKRSPTNHTSDIPSYIPINQSIHSSIFREHKSEEIKFIDSEQDCIYDDDLNRNTDSYNSPESKERTEDDETIPNILDMNNFENVITKSENMNHKNSTQGTIKRIGVDNSVPSTSRRSYQPEQAYIAEPNRDRISSIRSTLPISANSRANSAEQDNKNVAGLNGLRNIGNTCFMNSVLQCLSNTRLLTEYLKKDCCNGEIGSNGALIKAFSAVISELWAPGSSRVVNTSLLKSQVQKIAPRFMGYAQQDAQEFLRYLLEGLHEDINRVKTKPRGITTEIDDNLSDLQKSAEAWARYIRCEDSHIVDLFVGQLKSTLRCTICGHSSVTFDPFWDLSLPIPSRVGQLRLNQCLDLFTKEEILDGDEKPTCSKCQVRRKCTKRFSIQKFPKILVIHLKRFSPTERFRGKLNSLIDFPLTELDLSTYAAASGTPNIYNLYAVSNHSGTTYSGHYTAYCKHPYNHEWHEYNDSRVTSINSRSIVSNEAYVLFYELSNHQTSHL